MMTQTPEYSNIKNKITLVRQRDTMQCGVACLSMICHYYGHPMSIDYLSQYCTSTVEGVSMKALVDAASMIGLRSFPVKATECSLIAKRTPCILHWNQNHFVVLYKVDPQKRIFWIADPGKGKYRLSSDRFRKHWISAQSDDTERGIALFFEPTDRFGKITDNFEKRNLRSFHFLFRNLKQYRKYFIHITLGLLLGCVLQISLPFMTQSIVDIGIANNDIGFIWLILLGQLMIIVGRTAIDFIRRWILLHISLRTNISLISDFFIKLLQLPMSFFDTKLIGDLLLRIGDHSRIQTFLTRQILNLIFSFFSFGVLGTVLLIYDKFIFFIFLIGSILYGLWITTFLQRRKTLDYELFEQKALNQNKTYQFLTSIQEIKLQACERRRRWDWENTQADLFETQMRSLKLQQTQEAGSIFLNEIKNILITVLSATAVINGQITLGMMLAIQYIVGQLNSPVEQLMSFIYSLQDVKISLERINEIHTSRNEEDKTCNTTEFPSDIHSINFRNVDFKYDPHCIKNTLSNINFDIPSGKITAIVGPSGSGKTTLIKLILGYYPTNEGTISISGRKIDEYNLKWWRQQCGIVMQDGVIFSESIARNIAIDDGEIDMRRLEHAARIACIHNFVMSLPLKYDTKIGQDGVGISQGQRQRILIARAVYKQPDFIFLDEATNSLDTANERTIVDNLNKFYQGRTVVIVAHRLSTVKNADQIIVIENGHVAETGTHSSLISAKGAYYNLVKNQLDLEN